MVIDKLALDRATRTNGALTSALPTFTPPAHGEVFARMASITTRSSWLRRTTVLTGTLALALIAGACGDDSSANGVDGGITNPPNPSGLGPAPIAIGAAADLTAAGGYVLLAKAGITNVTGTLITGGNIGLSPAAASLITGFALTEPPTSFSTSVSIATPGKAYASDYDAPTPTNLTTAVLAMQAAYTDAAGRSDPDHLNLSSGALGGLSLEPGLYKFGTAVNIASNVTLAGGANDVWIFQISNELDLAASTQILFSGGAEAKNVFWQVAGEVTLQANSHFEGIVMAQKGITLQTNASLKGRLYAQTLIALDDNAITAP